jgi:hypothetical protein
MTRESNLEQLFPEHRLEISPLTGAAQLSVPLPLSAGRDGFGPVQVAVEFV